MKTTELKRAICTYCSGNAFDDKEGKIVEVSSLHISRIWRGNKEVDIYNLSQGEIKNLLEVNDSIENNYCHGYYRVIS